MNKLFSLTVFAFFFLAIKAHSQTTHIEAENFTAMNGIQTENTSDVGGGLNVGWQDNNDWMDYSLNLSTAATYEVKFRVASMFTGAQFQLRNSSGVVLAIMTVPNTGTFQTWQTISANVALPAGTQTLRIHTNAANGGWNINWWEIVGGGTTNQPPTVNAGADQTITLPASSVQLSASASDADGSISNRSWSKLSGPSSFTFSSTSVLNPTVSNLVQGSYTFRLTVTDNLGASNSDDIVVTVNAAPTPSGAWLVSGNIPSANDFIGTTDATDLVFKTNNIRQAKITSTGEFWAKKIKVTQSGWADYVFDSTYRLRPIEEVKNYIQQHRHLPDVPSAAQINEQGLNLGDNQALLLRKIEELTLYIINQQEDLKKQAAQIEALQKNLESKKNSDAPGRKD